MENELACWLVGIVVYLALFSQPKKQQKQRLLTRPVMIDEGSFKTETKKGLESLTVQKLREMARDLNVPKINKLRKPQLIEILEKVA